MGISANGYIAKADGNSEWTSDENLKGFYEQKGFTTAFLAGGGQLNTSFAKEGLIDEIYLDVEPLILGQGIKIFTDADFEFLLELLDFKKLNSNTIQLHYKVIKK